MPLPEALYNPQFAEYLTIIQYKYETDSTFRAICDDYETCKKMMESLVGRSLEYNELSVELEKEIIKYLKSIKPNHDEEKSV